MFCVVLNVDGIRLLHIIYDFIAGIRIPPVCTTASTRVCDWNCKVAHSNLTPQLLSLNALYGNGINNAAVLLVWVPIIYSPPSNNDLGA